MFTFSGSPGVLLTIVALLAGASGQSRTQKDLRADGLLVRPDAIIVFARFDACRNSPYDVIQMLVSNDGGSTWAARGPRLEGAGLRFFRDLPQRSGAWRISKRDEVVERRLPDGSWQRVPAPALMPCSDSTNCFRAMNP